MNSRAVVKAFLSTRIVAAAGILALSLMATPLATHNALAGLGGCGTDPVAVLSDGTLVDLTAFIADSPGDVSHIYYVVHAPAGTSVTAVYYTPQLAEKESVVVTTDNAPGTYDTDTVVQMRAQNVAVTVNTTVLSPSVGGQWTSGSGNASGFSGDDLTVHVALGQ